MIKTIVILFLCSIININFIIASKCYVCDDGACSQPNDNMIKTCDESSTGGSSGKAFVNGALNIDGAYDSIIAKYEAHLTQLGLNASSAKWGDVTQWACYVTKTKRRGCFIVGKGLCPGSQNMLSIIKDGADKIQTIMGQVKTGITKMFTGTSDTVLSNDQKTNISNWMAENYLSKLISNSNASEYQLDTCCDSDECNAASMIQKSIGVLSVLLLSIFILV